MFRLLQYYSRYQNARGALGGMPGWAKFILLIAAVPGIAGLALSLLALCVSIAALLLLTMPVYRLLSLMTGRRSGTDRDEAVTDFVEQREDGFTVDPMPTVIVETAIAPELQRPRRQIDVKIVE